MFIQSFPKNNRVQYLITPDEEHPTSEEMQSWIEQVELDPAEAPQEEEESQPLLSQFPEPGSVKQKIKYPELDMEEWILSNGARILLNKPPFKQTGFFSLPIVQVAEALSQQKTFYSSKMTSSCVRRSGLGNHSLINLQKIL